MEVRFGKKAYAATVVEMHWAKQDKTDTRFAQPEVTHYEFVRWVDGDPAPKIDKMVDASQFVDRDQKPKTLEEPMVRYMLRDDRTEEDA